GYTITQQLDFTEALNNALVVSGAKAERAAVVQNALSKAMAGGVLRGEELNTIIQQGGRVAELLAAQLNTTIGGLREMGNQGQITGDIIYNTLTQNLEQLRAEAEAMPLTIQDSFLLISNAFTQFIGEGD